jgi:hypothetical protein
MTKRIRTSSTDPKPDFLINKIKDGNGELFSLGTGGDGSKHLIIPSGADVLSTDNNWTGLNDFSGGFTIGANATNSGIEIGNSLSSGGLSFVDFKHGISTPQDFNVRFFNNGNETFLVATPTKNLFTLSNDNFVFNINAIPAADNALLNGWSGGRWSAIWSATGTIQTSDENLKEEIKETVLGLNFIMKLKPVQWKWKDEPEQEIIETYYEKEKDKKGLFKKLVAKTRKKIIEAKKYLRFHHGLLNQDVEKVLIELGLTTNDFAGYVKDKVTGARALRYEQFIAPLIKAVQEQQKKIEELEKKISKK